VFEVGKFCVNLKKREHLQGIRDQAHEAAKTWGLNSSWKRVYEDLAHAANTLDAFWARAEVRGDEEKVDCEGE